MFGRRLLLRLAAALALVATPAHAADQVPTCVHAEAATDRDAFARLVESEVDRHRTHRVVRTGCATHLEVVLVEGLGGRFLTGRVGGEVPHRVRVEGTSPAALEAALVELLGVVLGSDPVSLGQPAGKSWFGEKALALRDAGRTTFDFTVLESASLVDGRVGFLPGFMLGLTREIAELELGVEVAAGQTIEPHPGRLALDTHVRLQAALTYFFSSTADTSAFVGAAVGLAHQRFRGPRPVPASGEGVHHATGPALSLRSGVEVLRTTTLRAFALADACVPAFVADDEYEGVISAWVPVVSVGAGVSF